MRCSGRPERRVADAEGVQGAFIVSANRTKTGVETITLRSLAGNPVTLAG